VVLQGRVFDQGVGNRLVDDWSGYLSWGAGPEAAGSVGRVEYAEGEALCAELK
jgi:hypothetical protein